MARSKRSEVLRPMIAADVESVVCVQEPGAVRGLDRVFPQESYPFPREEVARRWSEEIESPTIDCYVVLVDDVIQGFAAVRHDEFLHFGIAVSHWGTGLAQAAHEEVLDVMRRRGLRRAWLRVFAENARGRRFYEKHGWQPTGDHDPQLVPSSPCAPAL